METSCLQRNSSEEIFLRSFMEGNAMAPVTDGMSFLAASGPQRADSEELFNNWLTNTDAPGLPPLWGENRTSQLSRRMSHELMALLGKQATPQPADIREDISSQTIAKNPDVHARGSHLGKPRNQAPSKNGLVQDHASWQMIDWFQQPHPMTRSRSSELRRKYLAMQDHTSPAMADSLQWFATQGTQALNRSLGAFTRSLASKRPSIASLASPQFPSSPNSPQSSQKNGDSLSAVVNMLKGSIERKKLAATQRQTANSPSPSYMRVAALGQPNEDQPNRIPNLHERIYQKIESQLQQQNQKEAFDATVQITKDQFQAGIVTPHASSPSDSSGGNATALSAGAATTEEPCNSNPTVSPHNNSMKCSGQNNWAVDETFQQNNLPSPTSDGTSNGDEGVLNIDSKKRQSHLAHVGTLASSCRSGFTADAEDSTKKRRVERKRMMTEAKGRIYVPAMPSDLQAAVKRCDALEKEVRSLKLNLSFMNRKDSEQTKQIEDLEKHNEELQAKNNGLLEDLKHLTSGKNFGSSV